MTNRYSKVQLQIDDYLDMLNLAASLGDVKWQKEIVRKLRQLDACIPTKQNV